MGFTFSTHILENATTSTMAMKPALTLLVLFAIIITMEARTPLTKMAKMTKMNKVAKMGHQATLVQKVMDDCDIAHLCPNGCCDQETDMGNDGDWTCCVNPAYVCAVDADTCDD